MKPGVARLTIAAVLALALSAAATVPAAAQAMGAPSPCEGFLPLRNDAQKKGLAIAAAEKRHVDRKELCSIVSRFYVAEAAALKYLQDNKTWCGVPDEAISSTKAAHEKTLKFREIVCAPAPQPRLPTLSDSIDQPSLDTAKNTKTGHGTFDTLTGNPLAK
jgi:hypothetical protein